MLLQKSKKNLKLIAENDFNTATARTLKQQLLDAIETAPKKDIVLVFNETDGIDGVGLKVLIGLYQECKRKDLELSLIVKNPSVLKTVHLCKLDQLIDVKES